MAKATTAKFHELLIEIEADPVGNPGVFSRICGLSDAQVSRTASLDTQEVPDCADESLPLSVEKSARSIEVSVSGTGVWSLEANKMMSDWFYSSGPKKVRILNAKAQADGASGEPYAEEGNAYLTELSNERTKGQAVSASIKIDFDGTPTITTKP